jgi:phosphoribosylformylglycinamidine synthase
MLVLGGASALSPFRADRLLAALRAKVPSVERVSATYVHFVAVRQELSSGERSILERLLEYSAERAAPESPDLVVVPRPGTISPWSSKATDIARRCGLDGVERIERGVAYVFEAATPLAASELEQLSRALVDRMIEVSLRRLSDARALFARAEPRPLVRVPLLREGPAALARANADFGLALSDDELEYLVAAFAEIGRDPTDVELVMFAQANSEHCRHKIFRADWVIDGERQHLSLFDMIKNTHARSPGGILSAYRDNAAVVSGLSGARFFPDPSDQVYRRRSEAIHLVMKAETHNHPTAISPHPGASTGAGGEIRDEGATGRGAKPKVGVTGFSVSHLRIPGFPRPWEEGQIGKPERIASPLEIMLEGPLGGAAFNDEFGRPNVAGYFRTFEQRVHTERGVQVYGYHKPIMLAGGLGNVRPEHATKKRVPPGALLVVIGGPALLIGLGGGAASSMASGSSDADLDFASVQRDNPEMQRRCQELIDRCNALGPDTPIVSIHDVGAGGLSNALPELVHDAGRGARIELRDVPSAEPGLSPMEIWCNEAQERYVLAILPERLDRFVALAERERCPFAVVGEATEATRFVLTDRLFGETAIDLPLEVLFGKPPKMLRDVRSETSTREPFDVAALDLGEAAERVLRLPCVADKTFLITIGDRSVTGLVARDQMVGPWQVPVADAALSLADYDGYSGEALAMGERAPVAVLDARRAARLAVAEAVTNIASAPIERLSDVKLSANWMAAAGHPGQDAALYAAVRAVGLELCPALGLAVPVGKDSLSMQTVWDGGDKSVVAPVSLVVTAFAPVSDVRRALTPMLRTDLGETVLVFVDLGAKKNRLGGSALVQVYSELGDEAPDLDDPLLLKGLFSAVQRLNGEGKLLAYHDRSDGGLFVTALEMAFAGHIGLTLRLDELGSQPRASLFSEELGCLLQVRRTDLTRVLSVLRAQDLVEGEHVAVVGRTRADDRIVFEHAGVEIFSRARAELHRIWSETTFAMQSLRDNPESARQEYERLDDAGDPGLCAEADLRPESEGPLTTGAEERPRVAVLREQGVNGQIEMAAAFDRAGFASVDVHMSDLSRGMSLDGFRGVVACGGFSYGDVLGAGQGWAKAVLYDAAAREAFERFFRRQDTFALGVCNGCQMLAGLKDLIPGAEAWPRFVQNTSEQFEARLCSVAVAENASLFLRGMQGTRLLVPVAHGEGRALFEADGAESEAARDVLVALRYVDHYGRVTERYPDNPNGSPGGIAGMTTRDGRVTIMMPHPERAFRSVQYSWCPDSWKLHEDGPWMRLFRNARNWVE